MNFLRVLICNPKTHKETFVYIPNDEIHKNRFEEVLMDNGGIYGFFDENNEIEGVM